MKVMVLKRGVQMGKSAILKKIHNAAKNYQRYLAGKTFMYMKDKALQYMRLLLPGFEKLPWSRHCLKTSWRKMESIIRSGASD